MIVFVHQGSELGGAERMLETLGTYLRTERGLDVAHFCPSPGPLAEHLASAPGHRPVTFPTPHRQRDVLSVARAAALLRRFAHARGATALIANAPRGHAYAGLASVGSSFSVVQVIHDPVPARDPLSALVSRLRPPEATVFASPRAYSESPPHMRARRRARVINAGIDCSRIDRALEDAPTTVDERLFLNVSRLQEHKGHDCLLHAFARVVAACPDARLICAGEVSTHASAAYVEKVERLAGSLALRDRVTFAGKLPDGELYRLMARSLALVHSARHESLGLVLLEAMYLGRPVIATRAEGPEQIVRDEETGLLSPIDDPDELAARMLRLVRDPALADAMGHAGRLRFDAHFSPETMFGSYESLLRELGALR